MSQPRSAYAVSKIPLIVIRIRCALIKLFLKHRYAV